jgi:Fur family ferric uptake transcriptional regulator
MQNNFIDKVKLYFKKNNIKITNQRLIIAKVIEDSEDHPNVDQIFERSEKFDKKINLATVYRSVVLFEKFGLIKKHYFGSQKARYEISKKHDHIIDIENNLLFEFETKEIEIILNDILSQMGYSVINYNLDVYVKKLSKNLESDNKEK